MVQPGEINCVLGAAETCLSLGRAGKQSWSFWECRLCPTAAAHHQPAKNPGAGWARERSPLFSSSQQRPGSRSAAELEVRGRVLWGLILAFSYTVFSFLTQNVWTANTDGLADTTNHPANITHT